MKRYTCIIYAVAMPPPPPDGRGFDGPPLPPSHGKGHPHYEPDNMRGFDPASEDDMDDNGMSRYMENNDVISSLFFVT